MASRAKEAPTRILHDYSHFAVLTIDKFFQRIIRSFVRELGIGRDFSLELKTESLLSGAADLLLEHMSTVEPLRLWIAALVEECLGVSRTCDMYKGLT